MRLKTIDPARIVLTVFVAGLTICASTTALAAGYTIKDGHSSGSSVTSFFSFGGLPAYGGIQGADNRSALSTFQGKDSLGDVHGQIVADYDTVGNCPGGYAFEVFVAKGVLNYKKGQLFLTASQASVPNQGCLVFDNYPALAPASTQLTIKYDIVGGTGEYEGASGELTVVSSGVLLHNYLVPGNDNQFGSFESNYEGWFQVD